MQNVDFKVTERGKTGKMREKSAPSMYRNCKKKYNTKMILIRKMIRSRLGRSLKDELKSQGYEKNDDSRSFTIYIKRRIFQM